MFLALQFGLSIFYVILLFVVTHRLAQRVSHPLPLAPVQTHDHALALALSVALVIGLCLAGLRLRFWTVWKVIL